MERTFRAIAFWVALVSSTAFMLVVIIAAVWAYLYVHAHPAPPGQEHVGSLTITYGILLIVAGAMFSGVFFGWRRERCEARQLRRQIGGLE